jgi:hypothetical protein
MKRSKIHGYMAPGTGTPKMLCNASLGTIGVSIGSQAYSCVCKAPSLLASYDIKAKITEDNPTVHACHKNENTKPSNHDTRRYVNEITKNKSRTKFKKYKLPTFLSRPPASGINARMLKMMCSQPMVML